MSTARPADPFRWLVDAGVLCRRHAATLVPAGFALVGAALLPGMLQMLAESASPAISRLAQLLFTLLGLLLMPPLLGGFLRLLRAADRGESPPASMLWSVFSDGAVARRLVSANLLFALVAALMIAGLVLAMGGDEALAYLRALSAMPADATPAQVPQMPAGVPALLGVMLILGLLLTTAQQLAAAAIALQGRGVLEASGAAAAATLRSGLALLLFFVPMLLVGALALAIIAGVVGVLVMVVGLLSKTLAMLLGGLLALCLLAGAYTLLLAFFYCGWRQLFGGIDAADAAPPLHQIAA